MSDTRFVGPGSGGVGTSTITMTASGQPNEGGSVVFNMPTFINGNSCLQRTQEALSSGKNTVKVPDNAAWCFILPPATNSTALYLRKADSADTTSGLQIGPNQGAAISFQPGTGRTFEIYTGAAVTVILAFF